jgi:ketosteroid isomerase-like protein
VSAGCDLLRRWAEAWNKRDLDAFMDCFDADAELITDPSFIDSGPFIGRAAIRGWAEGLTHAWEGNVLVVHELFEADGKVILRFDWLVHGRTTDLHMTLSITTVNAITDGRIVRQQYYFDNAAALRAVGLED